MDTEICLVPALWMLKQRCLDVATMNFVIICTFYYFSLSTFSSTKRCWNQSRVATLTSTLPTCRLK